MIYLKTHIMYTKTKIEKINILRKKLEKYLY